MIDFLQDEELERSAVVANNSMNRKRQMTGGNGYQKDLRFDVVDFLRERLSQSRAVTWVDLCCGEGHALLEAAQQLRAEEYEGATIEMIGVDLVNYFAAIPPDVCSVAFVEASLRDWKPPGPCDLVTCVHGLHYIGDKLGLLERIADWLKPDGCFRGHLDLANLRHPHGASLARTITPLLRTNGLLYESRHRLLHFHGGQSICFPLKYFGARDDAGPNYTGQPAVNSFYSRSSSSHPREK